MEEKTDYITEARQLIGMDLSEPKQIVQEVSGFTPIFDVVAQEHGNVTASIHGCAWRFCQMADGVCKASLSTIGEILNLDPATVSRHMKILVENEYFVDLTPDLRNRPHVYADTGKVVMKSKITARLAQNKATVAERKATVAESTLSKVIKKDSEDTGDKSPNIEKQPMEWQILAGVKEVTQNDQKEARRKDTANLVAMGCPAGAYDLVYAFLTARDIDIPESKVKGQRKAVREMMEMGVRAEHVTQAVHDLLAKNMTFIDLYGVSKTAIALANQKQVYTGDRRQHAL